MEPALWQADPHEFGPGKIHIIDPEEQTKTVCGRMLSAVPGKMPAVGKANCLNCCNTFAKRPEKKAREEEWRRKSEEFKKERQQEQDDFAVRYQSYMQSWAWQEKRRIVLRRANFQCEGCGEQTATQVHHLTYRHLGDELLWELKAVCNDCHEKIHNT